jgi:hypothetical protein
MTPTETLAVSLGHTIYAGLRNQPFILLAQILCSVPTHSLHLSIVMVPTHSLHLLIVTATKCYPRGSVSIITSYSRHDSASHSILFMYKMYHNTVPVAYLLLSHVAMTVPTLKRVRTYSAFSADRSRPSLSIPPLQKGIKVPLCVVTSSSLCGYHSLHLTSYNRKLPTHQLTSLSHHYHKLYVS